MNKRAFHSHLVLVIAGVALATGGCGAPDTPGRNRVIEGALHERYGFLAIPTGLVNVAGNPLLTVLKTAESAGLVRLRQIPQDYWSSFLSRTQGIGSPFEVTATPRLLGVAIVGTGSPKGAVQVLRVDVLESKIDKVVTEEEYKGPLATPGEKHYIILGLYRMIPTSAARVVGSGLAIQDEAQFRFRCVVRYSEFKKEWGVVAIDAGSVTPEQWFTSNVK
jgi:hypothetical protein